MGNVESELTSQVLGIVHALEAAERGELYYDGSDYIEIEDMDKWKSVEYEKKKKEFAETHPEDDMDRECYDSYEEWVEDEIGDADDVDEPDEVGIYDYLDRECLGDTRFEVDSSLELLGGKTLVCWGGPTVWIHDDQVCGYWGSDSAEFSLDSDTRETLLSWFSDQFEMAKASRR